MYCANPVALCLLVKRHLYYWACFSHQLSCHRFFQRSQTSTELKEEDIFVRLVKKHCQCSHVKNTLSTDSLFNHTTFLDKRQRHTLFFPFEGLLYFFPLPTETSTGADIKHPHVT